MDTKKYVCKICSNRYQSIHSLIRHETIHSENNPNRCRLCDKAFCCAPDVKKHEKGCFKSHRKRKKRTNCTQPEVDKDPINLVVVDYEEERGEDIAILDPIFIVDEECEEKESEEDSALKDPIYLVDEECNKERGREESSLLALEEELKENGGENELVVESQSQNEDPLLKEERNVPLDGMVSDCDSIVSAGEPIGNVQELQLSTRDQELSLGGQMVVEDLLTQIQKQEPSLEKNKCHVCNKAFPNKFALNIHKRLHRKSHRMLHFSKIRSSVAVIEDMTEDICQATAEETVGLKHVSEPSLNLDASPERSGPHNQHSWNSSHVSQIPGCNLSKASTGQSESSYPQISTSRCKRIDKRRDLASGSGSPSNIVTFGKFSHEKTCGDSAIHDIERQTSIKIEDSNNNEGLDGSLEGELGDQNGLPGDMPHLTDDTNHFDGNLEQTTTQLDGLCTSVNEASTGGASPVDQANEGGGLPDDLMVWDSIVLDEKERRFVCGICRLAYTSSKNLRRHLIVHSEDNPHKCSSCGKTFCASFAVKRHMVLCSKQKTKKQRMDLTKKSVDEDSLPVNKAASGEMQHNVKITDSYLRKLKKCFVSLERMSDYSYPSSQEKLPPEKIKQPDIEENLGDITPAENVEEIAKEKSGEGWPSSKILEISKKPVATFVKKSSVDLNPSELNTLLQHEPHYMQPETSKRVANECEVQAIDLHDSEVLDDFEYLDTGHSGRYVSVGGEDMPSRKVCRSTLSRGLEHPDEDLNAAGRKNVGNGDVIVKEEVSSPSFERRTDFMLNCNVERVEMQLGGPVFVCEFCHSSYSSKNDLEKHRFMHMNDNPYRCMYCNESFNSPFDVRRHKCYFRKQIKNGGVSLNPDTVSMVSSGEKQSTRGSCLSETPNLGRQNYQRSLPPHNVTHHEETNTVGILINEKEMKEREISERELTFNEIGVKVEKIQESCHPTDIMVEKLQEHSEKLGTNSPVSGRSPQQEHLCVQATEMFQRADIGLGTSMLDRLPGLKCFNNNSSKNDWRAHEGLVSANPENPHPHISTVGFSKVENEVSVNQSLPLLKSNASGHLPLENVSLVRGKNKPSLQQRYECLICSGTYSSKKSLSRHMVIHKEDNPYKCTNCGRRFCSGYDVKRHMKWCVTQMSERSSYFNPIILNVSGSFDFESHGEKVSLDEGKDMCPQLPERTFDCVSSPSKNSKQPEETNFGVSTYTDFQEEMRKEKLSENWYASGPSSENPQECLGLFIPSIPVDHMSEAMSKGISLLATSPQYKNLSLQIELPKRVEYDSIEVSHSGDDTQVNRKDLQSRETMYIYNSATSSDSFDAQNSQIDAVEFKRVRETVTSFSQKSETNDNLTVGGNISENGESVEEGNGQSGEVIYFCDSVLSENVISDSKVSSAGTNSVENVNEGVKSMSSQTSEKKGERSGVHSDEIVWVSDSIVSGNSAGSGLQASATDLVRTENIIRNGKEAGSSNSLGKDPSIKYECEVCGKSYMLKSSLKRHKIVHRKDNPNVCFLCGKAFCCPSDLTRHLRNRCIPRHNLCISTSVPN